VASTLSASAYYALASSFALYAAWRRAALRRRFGLPGGPVRDAAAWLCCASCALCQETRTLAHNNVTGGFWLGTLTPQEDAPQQTQQQAAWGGGGGVVGYPAQQQLPPVRTQHHFVVSHAAAVMPPQQQALGACAVVHSGGAACSDAA
jgi:hypothetical protein